MAKLLKETTKTFAIFIAYLFPILVAINVLFFDLASLFQNNPSYIIILILLLLIVLLLIFNNKLFDLKRELKEQSKELEEEYKEQIKEQHNEIKELEKQLKKYDDKKLQHDRDLFIQSRKRINEEELFVFLNRLQTDDSYVNDLYDKVMNLIYFFNKEKNTYLNKEINQECDQFTSLLVELINYLNFNFFDYPRDHDSNQYCLYPDLNIDRDGNGSDQQISKYRKYQDELYGLVNKVRNQYKSYRKKIKNDLIL